MKPGDQLPFKLESNNNEEVKLYDSIINSKKIKFVKFTAAWCAPCQSMKKWYEPFMNDNPQIDFIEIDLGERSLEGQRNNIISGLFDVKSIPNLVLISDKNEFVKVLESNSLNALIKSVGDKVYINYDRDSKSLYTIGQKIVQKDPSDNDDIKEVKEFFAKIFDKIDETPHTPGAKGVLKIALMSNLVNTCSTYVSFLKAEQYE